jgi:hypothetical protein
MLLVFGAVVVLAVVLLLVRLSRRQTSDLGSMSSQWLAEHRASHPQ